MTAVESFLFNPPSGAGSALGVEVVGAPVSDSGEITRAIEQLASKPDTGLILLNDDSLNPHSKLITELAIRHRVPAMYGSERDVPNGGLMYYGNVRAEQYRQAAIYVDRILKGAKPGELPVQAPSKFELKINLTTAKALGIEVPMGLLLRADELVE